MKALRRFLSLLLILCLLPVCSVSLADDNAALCRPYFSRMESFRSETLPFYMDDAQSSGEYPVYFINGETDIPFLSIADAVEIYNLSAAHYKTAASLSMEWQDGSCLLKRENGTFARLDPQSDTIFFEDADSFFSSGFAVQRLDLVDTYKKDGKTYLIEHKAIHSRAGSSMLYDLSYYCIEMLQWDGALYIPLQTFSDLFLCRYGFGLFCNGKILAVSEATRLSSDNQTELALLYRDVEAHSRSQALIQYNYNELCLALDAFYGLMEEHGIDNFADFFVQTGLDKELFSEDPMDVFLALSTLTLSYFGDKHSVAVSFSPMALDYTKTGDVLYAYQIMNSLGSLKDSLSSSAKYSALRKQYYPDGLKGYEEVGNTAYITFDQFKIDTKIDYYEAEITESTDDTVMLLLFANEQLHRENCPIENVVIDLSNNGGGLLDAAVCVISWFLGECNLYIEDVKSGAQSCTQYLFDGNLDGIFNQASDNVSGFRLFCIISPNSFSCGNMVPAAFAASDEVFLIGRKSGGGACAVLNMSDADGDIFTISSPYRINTAVNGSYISVDQGVNPDLVISDPAKLYDRAYMTELINNLP